MVNSAMQQTKTFIDTYYTPSNVKRDDDGVRVAKVITAYGFPDYPIIQVFKEKHVDGVFSIREPNSTALMDPVSQAPYGYEEHVPIDVACISKLGVTGTKLKWKMEAELRRITEAQPTGSLRSLQRRGDKDQRLGSTVLYVTEWVMNYRRDPT